MIDNKCFQIALAFFKRSDFERRNQWVGKFKGFTRNENINTIQHVFEALGGMNMYWRNPLDHPGDDNLYVEFKSESDLINATGRTIYYKTHKVYGVKRGEQWPNQPSPTHGLH